MPSPTQQKGPPAASPPVASTSFRSVAAAMEELHNKKPTQDGAPTPTAITTKTSRNTDLFHKAVYDKGPSISSPKKQNAKKPRRSNTPASGGRGKTADLHDQVDVSPITTSNDDGAPASLHTSTATTNNTSDAVATNPSHSDMTVGKPKPGERVSDTPTTQARKKKKKSKNAPDAGVTRPNIRVNRRVKIKRKHLVSRCLPGTPARDVIDMNKSKDFNFYGKVYSKKSLNVYNVQFDLLPAGLDAKEPTNVLPCAREHLTVLYPGEEEKEYDREKKDADDIADACAKPGKVSRVVVGILILSLISFFIVRHFFYYAEEEKVRLCEGGNKCLLGLRYNGSKDGIDFHVQVWGEG